jgi:UDP-glucose 4-epimerase
MNKEIIVFGGSGFLGSHVADALSEQGNNVTIFDLKASPYLRPDQKMVQGDIEDFELTCEVVKGKDIVYHFAGLSDLTDGTSKPIESVAKNIVGTVNLLEAGVKAGIERFVFASTIYVYSGLGGFYRCSKQSGELYIEEYQKKFSLNFTILRYGSLYGPRADERNAIWRYLKQGLQDGKIVYSGTGEETREFVHVRDASMLSVDILAKEFENQHVIISGHHPTKARNMLEMINEILGKKVSINYTGSFNEAHYNRTPYLFTPKVGKKLVSNFYVDIGQGLLECMQEISHEFEENKSSSDNKI